LNKRDKVNDASGGEKKQMGKRLGIREFVLVVVIILVVWAAQKCYNSPSLVPGTCDGAVNAYEDQVLDRTAP
jgi:hypothetical protein